MIGRPVFAHSYAMSLICDKSLLVACAALKAWCASSEQALPGQAGYRPLPGRIPARFVLIRQSVSGHLTVIWILTLVMLTLPKEDSLAA